MIVSSVKIANMALSHLGSRSTIESFDEASPEAKQAKLWYDISRQETLEALNWSFARKRQDLALHSDPADLIQWQYRYQMPVDCLKLRKLTNPSGPNEDAIPYEVEQSLDGTQSTILTNLQNANAVYTFDQTLTNAFSLLFCKALAFDLAFNMCYSLIGKTDVKDKMLQAFFLTLRAAASADANQSVNEPPREADWIRNR